MDENRLVNTQNISTKSGVTLIELIVVMLILVILAGFTFVAWPGRTITLNAQVKVLISDIRHAQTLALTKGSLYYLSRLSNTSYKISNSAGTEETTYQLSDGIQFGSFVNLPNNLIAFSTKGVPLTNLTGTTLSSTASITLTTVEGDSKTITITPQTGRVFS